MDQLEKDFLDKYTELEGHIAAYEQLDGIYNRILKEGMSRSIAVGMESAFPGIITAPALQFTINGSRTNQSVALEAIDWKRTTLIGAIIAAITALIIAFFAWIFGGDDAKSTSGSGSAVTRAKEKADTNIKKDEATAKQEIGKIENIANVNFTKRTQWTLDDLRRRYIVITEAHFNVNAGRQYDKDIEHFIIKTNMDKYGSNSYVGLLGVRLTGQICNNRMSLDEAISRVIAFLEIINKHGDKLSKAEIYYLIAMATDNKYTLPAIVAEPDSYFYNKETIRAFPDVVKLVSDNFNDINIIRKMLLDLYSNISNLDDYHTYRNNNRDFMMDIERRRQSEAYGLWHTYSDKVGKSYDISLEETNTAINRIIPTQRKAELMQSHGITLHNYAVFSQVKDITFLDLVQRRTGDKLLERVKAYITDPKIQDLVTDIADQISDTYTDLIESQVADDIAFQKRENEDLAKLYNELIFVEGKDAKFFNSLISIPVNSKHRLTTKAIIDKIKDDTTKFMQHAKQLHLQYSTVKRGMKNYALGYEKAIADLMKDKKQYRIIELNLAREAALKNMEYNPLTLDDEELNT